MVSSPRSMASPKFQSSPISPTWKGKGVRRASMPHVCTQLDPGSPNQESFTVKRLVKLARASTIDLPKPVSPLKRTQNTSRPSPNLTLLTPENESWGFGSIPRMREVYNEPYTPVSALESVLEATFAAPKVEPSNSSTHSSIIPDGSDKSSTHTESPNSSTHSSIIADKSNRSSIHTQYPNSSTHSSIIVSKSDRPSTHAKSPDSIPQPAFIAYNPDKHGKPGKPEKRNTHSSTVAELEDTSQLPPPATWPKIRKPTYPQPNHPPPPPPVSDSMEFKTTETTSRAVLKVVDETIAAIEERNRNLLSRAMAAEEAALKLQEQNSNLQQKISQYSLSYPDRPKIAPSQRKSRPKPESTPLSTFNATVDELLDLVPTSKDHKKKYEAYRKPASRDSSRHSSSRDRSRSRPRENERERIDSNILKNITDLSLLTQGLGFTPARPTPTPPPQQTQPHPQPQPTHPNPQSIDISRPVLYYNTPDAAIAKPQLITLSIDDKKRRPLPPLGPMSPSPVVGVVEIGVCDREERGVDGREIFDDGRVRKGKGNKGRGREKGKGFSGFFAWKKREVRTLRDDFTFSRR